MNLLIKTPKGCNFGANILKICFNHIRSWPVYFDGCGRYGERRFVRAGDAGWAA